ncbi:MAG: transcriptional repressor LexA [Spirochaetota bacterium]
MKNLTKRQKEVLAFIKGFLEDHGYPPTMREIAKFFKISAKGAHDHVKALEKKEMIRCDINRSRAIDLVGKKTQEEDQLVSIPILGNVAAGIPLFAEENQEGTILVPASKLKKGKHFALLVKGDSMQDAGILDGDMAVFVHQPVAENGNIVVAMINDAVTLKRFFKEKNRIKLKAENPIYPPIYTQSVQILGKLVYLSRLYD